MFLVWGENLEQGNKPTGGRLSFFSVNKGVFRQILAL